MDMISYDDFAKLDIRVGTIVDAQPHPNADKLLVLQINEGESQRQLVAGLKKYYSPEELIGKKIIFLANLEPRELRGKVSNGMILAAGKDGEVVVLTIDKEIPNGAKIS